MCDSVPRFPDVPHDSAACEAENLVPGLAPQPKPRSQAQPPICPSTRGFQRGSLTALAVDAGHLSPSHLDQESLRELNPRRFPEIGQVVTVGGHKTTQRITKHLV